MKITQKTLARAKAKRDKAERKAINLRTQLATHKAHLGTTSQLTMFNLTAAEGKLAELEMLVGQQEVELFGQRLEGLIDGRHPGESPID